MKNNYKKHCSDCTCLVEGDNGEWVCGEIELPCKEIKNCANWEDESIAIIED